MAESIYHIKLVSRINNYVRENINDIVETFILVDTPESLSKPTRTIGGFCPDFYYCFNNLLIIGEAKTINDIERNHSLSQYQSYIDEASLYNGKSLIIFAVPWTEAYTLKSILKKMLPNNRKIDVLILTDIGRVIEV